VIAGGFMLMTKRTIVKRKNILLICFVVERKSTKSIGVQNESISSGGDV